MTRSKKDPSLAVRCESCGAAAGTACVYTDGPYRGEKKLSGSHGGRLTAAADAGVAK